MQQSLPGQTAHNTFCTWDDACNVENGIEVSFMGVPQEHDPAPPAHTKQYKTIDSVGRSTACF